MNRAVTPATIAPPAANYAHAVVTDAPARWVHTSGVVPVRPDGSVPRDIAAQAAVVWDNLAAILDEAMLAPGDVISVTTYVVAGELDRLGEIMAARDAALGHHRAASTLVTVPALARKEWKVEISLIAAR